MSLRVLATAACAAVLAACGGDSATKTAGGGDRAAPWIDPDGEDPAVGSLAVEPGSGRVWLSTNRGLYEVRDGRPPRPVIGTLRTELGDGPISSQLAVGFLGPGEMIASGHPPSDSGLPPVIGLARSRDDGRTWESVSELGSSDFHVFALSKDRLIAAQYGEAQILLSADEGRTWQTRAAPGVMVDLAVDPADPKRWIATTQEAIFTSADGGVSWRPRDPMPNAHLAWARSDVLYRLDPDGPVRRSADGGRTWKQVGELEGEPAALTAHERDLYAARVDGTVLRSSDEGRTWSALTPG